MYPTYIKEEEPVRGQALRFFMLLRMLSYEVLHLEVGDATLEVSSFL